MTIQVTSILKDSSGAPSPNTPLKLATIQGSSGTLPTAIFETITDIDGNYDFNVNIGVHYLSVRYDTEYEIIGKIIVNADTPSPTTLDILLSLEEPLTPEQVLQIQQLVAEATEAANNASNSAQAAAQSEQAVEEDRQEVATNTAAVEQNAQAVESARSEVEQNTQTVATNTQTVSDKTAIVVAAQADVTAKAQQVSDDASQVAQDKSDTAASALLAQMWAAGSSPTPSTPSDTNNAKYWSDRAAQFVTGALIYGGQFTPTTETPYPPTSEIDTMYLVNFTDSAATFTYTSGDLNGVTVKNGNSIIYNVRTSGSRYEASSFVFTGVATVNGKSPDASNNVQINASDVGAYSQTETDDLLAPKASTADVNTALAQKANVDDVNAALAQKANTTDVNNALAEKADSSSVNALLLSLLKSRIGDIVKKAPNTADDFDNSHVRLKGQLLSRVDDKPLWEHILATQGDQLVDDTAWLALKASSFNGAVSVFSKGNGSTTFRMIDEGDGGFDRSTGNVTDPVLLNVGFQDQIVNISGRFEQQTPRSNGQGAYGVFEYETNTDSVYGSNGTIAGERQNGVGVKTVAKFDASRQVRTGSEVQPKGQFRKAFMYTGRDLLPLM